MKWFISVVAIVAATTITLAQYPEGHWQNFAPYPQPTQEVGGAVVNGKLYILGGAWNVLRFPEFPAQLIVGIAVAIDVDWNETNRRRSA